MKSNKIVFVILACILLFVGILIGGTIGNMQFRGDHLVDVDLRQSTWHTTINNSAFKPGRYAICIEDRLDNTPVTKSDMSGDFSISVEQYDSNSRLLERKVLGKYLAHIKNESAGKNYFVVSEFVGKGIFTPERKIIVSISSNSAVDLSSRIRLFISFSPIP